MRFKDLVNKINNLAVFFHKLRHNKGIKWDNSHTIGSLCKKLRIKVELLPARTVVSLVDSEEVKDFKNKFIISVKDKGRKNPVIDRTKTYCYMVCGDVPFGDFRCIMVCITCTDEWGGGCGITIYY